MSSAGRNANDEPRGTPLSSSPPGKCARVSSGDTHCSLSAATSWHLEKTKGLFCADRGGEMGRRGSGSHASVFHT